MMKNMRMKITALIVLLLEVIHCFAHVDGIFLIYNAHKNRCLTDHLLWLEVCNPLSPKQQFRWVSDNRILNINQKKCLGIGSRKTGNKLQWYLCNAKNDLQKWECTNNLHFKVKNESLYLSLQGEIHSLTLSKNTEDKGQWTIHGTTDSICSQPYEELYTLGGNGLGRPCHFPFSYKNKWYADCTREEATVPWCAIERTYEDNQLWGHCPSLQIDNSWRKNPLTGMYYQVNQESALTWYQARKSCQQQGGELSSITEPHDQTFLSGLSQGNGPVLWIGLNSLDDSSGWQWNNRHPLRYFNWLSGQPSSEPGHTCGAISQQYDFKWSTDVCSAKHGYICQKALYTPTVPPVVHTGSCPRPWIPNSGHCYHLNRSKKTWLEARDACRRDGGDLLSILNVEEQSFVISQLVYLKTDKLWIGLNDLKTAMFFEWSDHSSVPFVSWEKNEPSHNAGNKEDCVLISGEEGKWSDEICKNKYGFICKKDANLSPSANDTVITSPGCKPGWTRYGYHCYFVGMETKTFEEAKESCGKTQSYLVDISSRIENAFLVSLVGMRPEKHFWIGLSNQKNQHTFEWTNSSKVLYTHFNAGMPGGKQGCIAITTGTLAGLWDVLSCTNKEKYICKCMAENIITTLAPMTTPAPSCSQDWFPLMNRDLCFKLFSVPKEQQKTWSEALSFCRELGGDLLSIHSLLDLQLTSTISNDNAWIGYSIQDPSVGYVWSDGSPTSYENWQVDEPNNYNNVENCVEMAFQWWSKTGEWNDLHCDVKNEWFCEIKRGVTPNEVELTTQTYNNTEDGWIIFNDHQYYFSKYIHSMEAARWFCRQRHGDLVSINDEKERLFLWHQVKTHSNYYIGMVVDLDKSFTWMDGSPVVFEAWQKNQPAFLNSEERCVLMSYSQGLWETTNCGEDQYFICKRSGSVEVNSTAAPTEPPKGGCAPDWIKFQEKCYKIGLEPKTWTEARSFCRHLGGDLASITSRLQQAFLTLLIDGESSEDLWIGFSNLAKKGFKWTDGRGVSYTNLANRQQKGEEYMWMWESEEPVCAALGSVQSPEFGKWVIKRCNDTSGFICSRAIDHFIEPSPTNIPTTFMKLGNDSYWVLQKNLTWSEAKHQCESKGAHLASIRNLRAQAFIEVQTSKLNQPLWIGLNSKETDGYFLWIDNWQLNMEDWDYNEPKSNHPCVYVDVDGKWKTAYCNQTSFSICKKSADIAPSPPTQFPGVCPEVTEAEPKMIWLPYRGHCYAFVTQSVSWSRASMLCLSRGANLVSIEDTKEQKFIEQYISFLGNYHSSFSIGLFKTHTEHWLWLDRSVMDYTNWDEDAENDYDGACACISTTTKRWGKHHCLYTRMPFICKTPKVPKPTSSSSISPTEGTVKNKNPAGVAVAVVIAMLFALAALAFTYHRWTRSRVAAPSYENPMYYTTDAPVPEDKDTKTLVDHMENNY